MRLREQILVYLVAPLIMVFVFVISANLYRDHKRMVAKDIMLIEEELQQAALKINADNLEAVTVARTLAASQESGLFGQREESVAFLRQVLAANPQFIGVSIGYDPDADGNDALTLKSPRPNPEWSDGTGRFLPYWYRDLTDEGKIKLEALVEMDNALYYAGVRSACSSNPDLTFLITEPYVYNNLNLIIEQMSPIIIDGNFRGVCGVDRSLDYVHEYLMELRDDTFQTAQFTLISGRGRIIATTLGENLRTININDFYVRTTDDGGQVVTDIFSFDGEKQVADQDRLARLMEQKPDETYRSLFHSYALVRKDTEPVKFFDPITQSDGYIASAFIPTGGWRLVMTVSKDEIVGPTRRAILYTAGFGLLGVFVMMLVIIVFANRFSARIGRANELAQTVARGDLTPTVTIDSKDETGQLLSAIQTMLDSLNALILQVKQSTIQLVSTATRITSTAKIQESTVQDFGTSTAEIATAVNEISTTSRELYNTMSGISGNSAETAQLAEAGRNQLEEMGQTMDSLSEATQSISGKLAIISEKAQNIDKVVTAISKVSEQTNLLSLNAAIEAEKAGEYGLGFAVVAREIRRLANQTSQASVDISGIVGEMQNAVSSGVMEMDRFSEGVRGGVGEISDLGSQLEDIIDRVQQLSPRFDSVKEGMSSQTQGAQQISEAMSQLREGAQRTSDSLTEFDEATRALHNAVNGLRREVSRFKVSEGNSTGLTRMPFPVGSKKQPPGKQS